MKGRAILLSSPSLRDRSLHVECVLAVLDSSFLVKFLPKSSAVLLRGRALKPLPGRWITNTPTRNFPILEEEAFVNSFSSKSSLGIFIFGHFEVPFGIFFFFNEWENRMGRLCPFSSLHPLRKGKESQ